MRDAAVTRALLESGADANTPDKDGRAPLHAASAAGDVETITALLDGGAAIEAKDGQGRTPLLVAVEKGSMEAVRALIKRGADKEAAFPARSLPCCCCRRRAPAAPFDESVPFATAS